MIPKSFQKSDNKSKTWFYIRIIILTILLVISLLFYESRKIKYTRYYITSNSTYGDFLASRFAIRNNDLEEGLQYTKSSIKLNPDNVGLLSKGLHLATAL